MGGIHNGSVQRCQTALACVRKRKYGQDDRERERKSERERERDREREREREREGERKRGEILTRTEPSEKTKTGVEKKCSSARLCVRARENSHILC